MKNHYFEPYDTDEIRIQASTRRLFADRLFADRVIEAVERLTKDTAIGYTPGQHISLKHVDPVNGTSFAFGYQIPWHVAEEIYYAEGL